MSSILDTMIPNYCDSVIDIITNEFSIFIAFGYRFQQTLLDIKKSLFLYMCDLPDILHCFVPFWSVEASQSTLFAQGYMIYINMCVIVQLNQTLIFDQQQPSTIPIIATHNNLQFDFDQF